MTAGDGDRRAALPARLRALGDRRGVLATRARVLRALHGFFEARGFLHLETPARVTCPGLEPHLVPFPAGGGRWLITSPELHLKKALVALAAAGDPSPRVYEVARVFRDDETGPWHLPEFTMVEWYRAGEGLDALVRDLEELLPRLAEAAGADPRDASGTDLTLPFERLSVRDAFARYAAIDLAACRERDDLAAEVRRLGLPVDPGDTWDDLFFRAFLDRVEPRLGRARATILEEYPASQCALARVREDPGFPVALRFELYAGGVELANAFDELTDPVEQRRRHEADRAARRAAGLAVPDLDEEFLAALEAGMPPAAGIALGFDRLLAVLLGLPGASEVVAFPPGGRGSS